MKTINEVTDISLDDLKSILTDIEQYPKDFCSEEVNIIKKAIRKVMNDILDLTEGKRADEIIITCQVIDLTKKIYAIYDWMKDKLYKTKKGYNSDTNPEIVDQYNNKYYEDLASLYKSEIEEK